MTEKVPVAVLLLAAGIMACVQPYAGGEEPHRAGFTGKVYLEKPAYVNGEPILLAVRVSNNGNEDLFFEPPEVAGVIMPTLFPAGRRHECRTELSPGPVLGTVDVIRLRPGEVRAWKYSLNGCMGAIYKGSYQADVAYVMRSGYGGVLGRGKNKRVVAPDRVLVGKVDIGSVFFDVGEGNEADNRYFRDHGVLSFPWGHSPQHIINAYRGSTYIRDYWRYLVGTMGANQVLEDMVNLQPRFHLTDDAIMILARGAAEEGKPEAARTWLQRLLKEHPKGDCQDEAAYNLKHGFALN